jgi:hypothetical protein
MTTAGLLRWRLQLVFEWYQGMVNPDTGMLEYLHIPQTGHFVRENCPIREIASIWDMELLGDFLGQQALRPLIERSLRHYAAFAVDHDGWLLLDPGRLGEPSSIAHSAFMMLALLHAPPPRQRGQIAALAEGILRQQRADGSYRISYDELPDSGEELYAGEAMLALLEAHRQLHDARCLQSAARAFRHYDAQYFRRGRVAHELLVFFANWQSQACRLLFEDAPDSELQGEVARFVFDVHDRIIDRGLYDDVERHPARHTSVEIACALEGLNEACALARAAGDARAAAYRACVCRGLEALLALQCVVGGAPRERGGFGLSSSERSQRVDITGHAASAIMKALDNGIECAALA